MRSSLSIQTAGKRYINIRVKKLSLTYIPGNWIMEWPQMLNGKFGPCTGFRSNETNSEDFKGPVIHNVFSFSSITLDAWYLFSNIWNVLMLGCPIEMQSCRSSFSVGRFIKKNHGLFILSTNTFIIYKSDKLFRNKRFALN